MSVENLIDAKFRGWTLTRCLGRGADGIVYEGRKEGSVVAIKLFFPESLATHGLAGARDRLDLQLTLVGKKHHPHLVEVFDGGEDAALGTLFLIMELVPGTSLEKLIGKIPVEKIEKLAGQLADVAKFLDHMDLVHRDIKPANIVVSDDFECLTLLDLGIVYQLSAEDDDKGRISGMEFVATLRYSPPEFVWRIEQGEGAWRAVTLYQIGATLHDVIMGVPLFSGLDTPRARLYDAVRDHTPVVHSQTVPQWLVQTVQACLLKDWRQRIQFADWKSFEPAANGEDVRDWEQRIRLAQVRKEEMRLAALKTGEKTPAPTREQQLWNLNNALMLEIRTYLSVTSIFPKCGVVEKSVSQSHYENTMIFEGDETKGFPNDVSFNISLALDDQIEGATKLSFSANKADHMLSSATWTEMFTVETSFAACRQAFLGTVESMISV